MARNVEDARLLIDHLYEIVPGCHHGLELDALFRGIDYMLDSLHFIGKFELLWNLLLAFKFESKWWCMKEANVKVISTFALLFLLFGIFVEFSKIGEFI